MPGRTQAIMNAIGGMFRGGAGAADSGKINMRTLRQLRDEGIEDETALIQGARESSGGIGKLLKSGLGIGAGAVILNAVSGNGIVKWFGNQAKKIGAEVEETTGFQEAIGAQVDMQNLWIKVLSFLNAIFPNATLERMIDERTNKVATLNDRLKEKGSGPYGAEDGGIIAPAATLAAAAGTYYAAKKFAPGIIDKFTGGADPKGGGGAPKAGDPDFIDPTKPKGSGPALKATDFDPTDAAKAYQGGLGHAAEEVVETVGKKGALSNLFNKMKGMKGNAVVTSVLAVGVGGATLLGGGTKAEAATNAAQIVPGGDAVIKLSHGEVKEGLKSGATDVAGVAGFAAGGAAGAALGAQIGGGIGALFLGAGAIPGAAIGGAIGFVGGGLVGSGVASAITEKAWEAGDAVSAHFSNAANHATRPAFAPASTRTMGGLDFVQQ